MPPRRIQPATDTALFLDVDGVLCPVHSLETDPGWGPVTVIDDPGFGELAISLDMAAALMGAPVELMWCTDWQDIANMAFAPYLGQALPHLTRPWEAENRWWKLDAIHHYLDTHTQIRRFIWIDDHLDLPEEDGEPRSTHAAREFQQRGVPGFLIAPEKTVGLTKKDWDRATDWLRDP